MSSTVPIRVVAADITSGRRLIDVPFTGGSFTDTLNDIGSLSVDVPLYDFDVRALNLSVTGAAAHTLLGCTFGDRFMQGGPIWKHTYDKDKQVLNLQAANSWSYWNKRLILPVAGDTTSLILADGSPNPATNTVLSNMDFGTMVKRIIQTTSRAGEDLPIVFQDDRAGTRTQTYLGSDLKFAGPAIKDLTERINGPDVRFDMEWTPDRLGLLIRLRTGTESEPRLYSQSTVSWDYTVKDRSIRGLNVDVDAQGMGNVAWATGGRTNDILLLDRRADAGVLKSRGYPRLDLSDTSHSSVTEKPTLVEYNQENLRLGQDATTFWEFEVRTDVAPYFGTYGVGDYCEIIIKNDPYIADGIYLRRIVAISCDFKSQWAKITTGNVVGLGPVDG